MSKIPLAAWVQWAQVGSVLFVLFVIGLFVVPFTILFSKKMTNYVGESEQPHSDKYIADGSSGYWYYVGCNVPFLQWFSNLEDGNYGEPSGKHSARSLGNEASFTQQYYWLALRNPVNYLKRTNPFFHCLVDNCDIEHVGDYRVDDKDPYWGEQLVTATERNTGKKYYGYYKTEKLDDKHCRVWRFGFKVKPSHAEEVQDADDKDKAFTFRHQHKSEIN